MPEEKIQEIINALDHYDGKYKREAIEAALELKEEITPRLLAVLEEALADPKKYYEEGHYANVYVLILLSHFRESKAHKLIVDLFSLPVELLDPLVGDMITEDLPALLYSTCNGSLELIKELVLNKNAYEYCRTAALRAITYAVADAMISREEALDFFSSLFTGNEAENTSDFWGGAAACIDDIYPYELMPVIRKAYDDELISSGYIGLEDFERTLAMEKDYALEKLKVEMAQQMHEEIHDRISWWAAFDEKEKEYKYNPPACDDVKTKKKPDKKKKRKMAKASRKKNKRR